MDRSKSIEVCGKVLGAVRILQRRRQLLSRTPVEESEKVRTEDIAEESGLTEKQVEQAIEVMTRGKHPQVDGDRYGVWRINDIRHTY